MKHRSIVSNWILSVGVAVASLTKLQLGAKVTTNVNTTESNLPERHAGEEFSRTRPRRSFEKKARSEDSKSDTDMLRRLNNFCQRSPPILDEIHGTPDKGIPKNILSDARCIGLFALHAKHRRRVGRPARGKASLPVERPMAGVHPLPSPFGWKLGFANRWPSTDLVMLVMNKKGMDHLLSSKFKIGAEATGAAGPGGTPSLGRHRLEDES